MYILREIQKKDIPKINKWRNSIELMDYLGAPFRYINLEVDYIWYENYMQNRKTVIRCAIVEDTNENNILGLVSLTNINFTNQTAEFHILIGDMESRGKGIGYFATKEILKHSFYNMNLNRVELGVLEYNIAALKLYEEIGFKREGLKRQAIYKNGSYVDLIIMSILKNEFVL